MENTYFLSIQSAPSNKICDLESNLFAILQVVKSKLNLAPTDTKFLICKSNHNSAISQVLKVNWILPQQSDKILDLESELKIEREWRQQLEAASHQEKETIYKMKEEMVYLLKVASVSTVMIWGPFHKSWAHGVNHRDSSIHLRPTLTPNFLRSFLLAPKLGARA